MCILIEISRLDDSYDANVLDEAMYSGRFFDGRRIFQFTLIRSSLGFKEGRIVWPEPLDPGCRFGVVLVQEAARISHVDPHARSLNE